MKKNFLLLAVGFALGLLAGILVLQFNVVKKLQAENAALRAQAAQVDDLLAEIEQLKHGKISDAELQRLRDGQAELLRLRGEVTTLRRKNLEPKPKPAATKSTPAANTNAADSSPVQTFKTTVTASVGWNQTVATGGWLLPDGKRVLVFAEPVSVADTPDSVMIKNRFVEVPDALLDQFGLGKLRAGDSQDPGTSQLFTAEQSASLLKTMETTDGVEILAAPTVITANGRQAQMSVTHDYTAPNGQVYSLGPTVDIVPHISADGQAVDMTITPQLTVPRTNSVP